MQYQRTQKAAPLNCGVLLLVDSSMTLSTDNLYSPAFIFSKIKKFQVILEIDPEIIDLPLIQTTDNYIIPVIPNRINSLRYIQGQTKMQVSILSKP